MEAPVPPAEAGLGLLESLVRGLNAHGLRCVLNPNRLSYIIN